jgi:hypothetical protein
MQINSQAVPEPTRVELPIALVLWDGLRLARRMVDENLRSEQSALGSLKNFKQLLTISKEILDKLPLSGRLGFGKMGVSAIISFFREYMERRVIPERESEINDLGIQDQDLLQILEEFGNLVEKLETEFLASKLADVKER